MKAIINGTISSPVDIIQNGVVTIENEKILQVGSKEDLSIPDHTEIIDAQGQTITPGFIDLHTHGLMGHDVMGDHLRDAIPMYPQFGVTSFMATTLTLPREEVLDALGAMSSVLESPPKGADCLGIHVEGPHLSPEKPGMATAEWFYPLTKEDFDVYQKTSGNNIRMITFAPEIGDAKNVIPHLLENNVTPVIGHSNATFDEVTEAVKLGLSQATHTYNAMRPLNHREPGTVGGVMFYDQIYAELIADGIHIHPAAMEILIRAKGLEKVVLISDSSPYGGMPEGEYEWEHKPLFVKDGICRLENGTIAGAHAELDSGVRNLVNKLNLPLSQSLIPATISPAASVGIKNKGQIKPGFDADIVILDESLHPVKTLVRGDIVWEK